MTRQEKAQYLYHLHCLMQAIDPTPVWLATEYQKVWDELKDEVKKEQSK